jgi:ribosomal protein L22
MLLIDMFPVSCYSIYINTYSPIFLSGLIGDILMKRTFIIVIIILTAAVSTGSAGFLDSFLKDFGLSSKQELDNSTIISGLKEALSVGTEDAVKAVSKIDGYLANEAIAILMPEKFQQVADVMKKVGYEKPVDDFIMSMNRAAEKAAPKATSHILSAIKGMTIEDAKQILEGGDTAATDYFKLKTSDKLYDEFMPVVSSSMDEVGVTSKYKEMMDKYLSLPFVNKESLDLDHYVTNKSLEGLFYMIGEEEKKIRTDPAARVTDLLKKVFSK